VHWSNAVEPRKRFNSRTCEVVGPVTVPLPLCCWGEEILPGFRWLAERTSNGSRSSASGVGGDTSGRGKRKYNIREEEVEAGKCNVAQGPPVVMVEVLDMGIYSISECAAA
ncbi:unnamed protein product, partial [Choristocarpus tenellus]